MQGLGGDGQRVTRLARWRWNKVSAYTTGSGTEIFTCNPEALRPFQAVETIKWGEIIKAAEIETE